MLSVYHRTLNAMYMPKNIKQSSYKYVLQYLFLYLSLNDKPDISYPIQIKIERNSGSTKGIRPLAQTHIDKRNIVCGISTFYINGT